HPDLPHTGRHTARFHRLAPGQGVLPFDPWIARNAFLAHPRGAPVHRLLIRALLHTLLVAPAAVLVDQHDPIFGALIDRLARAGRQAAGIGTVVTDPLQIEEERLVLRQTAPRHLPRFVPREARLVDPLHQGPHRGGRILIN